MAPPPPIEHWQDYVAELHPPEALKFHIGYSKPIQELHIEGGIVEIIDPGILEPKELAVVTLGALGLTDPQIAQSIQYSPAYVKRLMTRSWSKLGAVNRTHAVTQLFRNRHARVIAPIDLPDLPVHLINVLQQNSEGKRGQAAAAALHITPKSVETFTSRITDRLETSNNTRAVMLGYMGRMLLPSPDFQTEKAQSDSNSFCITPGSGLRDPSNNQLGIDYVEWKEGVFSFRDRSTLLPAEQLTLALSAIGLTRQEVGILSDISMSTVGSRLDAIYTKLRAHNRPHAVTRALASKEIRITRTLEPVYLEREEWQTLFSAAQGISSAASEQQFGFGEGMARKYSSRILDKMGVVTITGAVLRGYMSRMLDVDEVTGTSGATPPAWRRSPARLRSGWLL